MSLLKSYIFLLLLSILPSILLGQEKREQWQRLKEASHAIGFCVYNTDMPFCNDHELEKEKREQAASKDDEVFYFIMKKEWAAPRVAKWAQRQHKTPSSGLILFDIRQGKKPANVTRPQRPYNSFLLLSLSDSIAFNAWRTHDEYTAAFIVNSPGEQSMLENGLWREFMTGRLGRLVDKATFNIVVDGGVNSKYQQFQQAFENFQQNFVRKK